MDFVLHPVNEEVEILPVVVVVCVSERNHLNRLPLLQDAAGGAEAVHVFSNEFSGDVANFLIRKSLDRINQHILIHKERVSSHFLKLLIRKFRLTVRDKVIYVVFPCDRELDEVHQVLSAMTNFAGFEAVTVTGDTSFAPSTATGRTALVSGSTVTVAKGAAFLASAMTADTASSSTAMTCVAVLDKGGVWDAGLDHHVSVPLRQ